MILMSNVDGNVVQSRGFTSPYVGFYVFRFLYMLVLVALELVKGYISVQRETLATAKKCM